MFAAPKLLATTHEAASLRRGEMAFLFVWDHGRPEQPGACSYCRYLNPAQDMRGETGNPWAVSLDNWRVLRWSTLWCCSNHHFSFAIFLVSTSLCGLHLVSKFQALSDFINRLISNLYITVIYQLSAQWPFFVFLNGHGGHGGHGHPGSTADLPIASRLKAACCTRSRPLKPGSNLDWLWGPPWRCWRCWQQYMRMKCDLWYTYISYIYISYICIYIYICNIYIIIY